MPPHSTSPTDAATPCGQPLLDSGQVWQLDVGLSAPEATIWGRTNCNFNSSGRGQCETGGCNGVLQCQSPGSPPNTLAKFSINERTLDYVILTLVEGFNIPMEISPTTDVCPNRRCTGPIKEQCPHVLRAPGGCNSACTVFGTNEYCCTNGNCGTTKYSSFFKQRCPDAYSYPQDAPTSLVTCPPGISYRVVFCP